MFNCRELHLILIYWCPITLNCSWAARPKQNMHTKLSEKITIIIRKCNGWNAYNDRFKSIVVGRARVFSSKMSNRDRVNWLVTKMWRYIGYVFIFKKWFKSKISIWCECGREMRDNTFNSETIGNTARLSIFKPFTFVSWWRENWIIFPPILLGHNLERSFSMNLSTESTFKSTEICCHLRSFFSLLNYHINSQNFDAHFQ